jgi:hypothetical protein
VLVEEAKSASEVLTGLRPKAEIAPDLSLGA